jgi:hypothetical protein
MADPLKIPDDLDALEKQAWAEFEKTLDLYIAQYAGAVGKFLREKKQATNRELAKPTEKS